MQFKADSEIEPQGTDGKPASEKRARKSLGRWAAAAGDLWGSEGE